MKGSKGINLRIDDHLALMLENRGIVIVHSEIFRPLNYAITKGHICIFCGKNSGISIAKENIKDFCTELMEINESL